MAAALAATGCAANRPFPASHPFLHVNGQPAELDLPFEHQLRMEAVRHWQLLAKKTAQDIARSLVRDREERRADLPLGALEPLHVAAPAAASPFERGLRELLVTELVRAGLPVAAEPGGAGVQVTSEVQVITYERDVRFDSVPGRLTALHGAGWLGYGFWLLGGIPAKYLASGVAALAADAVILHEQPNTELIVTTSMTNRGGYVQRMTSLYYVKTDDATLYAKPPAASSPSRRTFALADRCSGDARPCGAEREAGR